MESKVVSRMMVAVIGSPDVCEWVATGGMKVKEECPESVGFLVQKRAADEFAPSDVSQWRQCSWVDATSDET